MNAKKETFCPVYDRVTGSHCDFAKGCPECDKAKPIAKTKKGKTKWRLSNGSDPPIQKEWGGFILTFFSINHTIKMAFKKATN